MALHPAIAHLRAHLDRGDRVTSVLRCEAHNKAVGGTKGSKHLTGEAVDVLPENRRSFVVRMLTAVYPYRIITYLGDDHVHVQVAEQRALYVHSGGKYIRAV
jgi:hypothetical protein